MGSVMSRPYLISAIGTPLTDSEELHVEMALLYRH